MNTNLRHQQDIWRLCAIAAYATMWLPAHGQLGFVLDTGKELSISADFNGDGFEDAAVATKESGVVRIGIGDENGIIV